MGQRYILMGGAYIGVLYDVDWGCSLMLMMRIIEISESDDPAHPGDEIIP